MLVKCSDVMTAIRPLMRWIGNYLTYTGVDALHRLSSGQAFISTPTFKHGNDPIWSFQSLSHLTGYHLLGILFDFGQDFWQLIYRLYSTKG